MAFRIIVRLLPDPATDERGYARDGREVFAQDFENVDIAALARFLNSKEETK